MSFLYDNIAVIVVAGVASVMAWMFGGARGDVLVPVVPWLLLLMIEVLYCFPQRHRGESIYEARERVWEGFRHGSVFWFSLGFLALLLIPFVNNGLCVDCDAALIAQGVDPKPRVPILPFCVNRLEHLTVFFWFAVALLSAVAVTYCLTRRGKRLVIQLIVWNGVALAVFGFVQSAMGAHGPLGTEIPYGDRPGAFFSTFAYPNLAGDYFTTIFGLSIALWRDHCEHLRAESEAMDPSERANVESKNHGLFWRRHFYLMPAAVCFFAAMNTLSRAAILLVTATACVYFFHTLAVILSRLHRSRRVYVGVWSLLVFGLIIFFASVFTPKDIQKEMNTLSSSDMLNRVTGKGNYHGQVATAIWREHMLFGVGGWGYRHFCVPTMRRLAIDTRSVQVRGGANVHNDGLQFLAEHGTVGCGLLIAVVILLVWPILEQWRLLIKATRFNKSKHKYAKPVQIFVLPASVFFILTTAVATLVHSFFDCPLRSSATLTLFFISLASLTGFMPETDRTRRR